MATVTPPLAKILAAALVAAFHFGAAAAPSPPSIRDDLKAVTTYESAGLYWTAPGGKADCRVRYRAAGETSWRIGFDLWFDARNNECRGKPGAPEGRHAVRSRGGPRATGPTASESASRPGPNARRWRAP